MIKQAEENSAGAAYCGEGLDYEVLQTEDLYKLAQIDEVRFRPDGQQLDNPCFAR